MPSDLKPEDDLPTPVNGETKTTSLTQLAWKAPKHPQIQPYEWWSLLGIVLLTIPLRLYSLSHPAEVVFDEVHIGKYISQYIKRQYFVDVHPPLARLLIYLTSILGGYDGNFEFEKITQPYTKSVPYILMRSLPAIYGIALVPIAYLTLRAFGCRSPSALLASLAVAFENGLIVQSRLFMLDSCMLYFIALALMSWTYFSAKDTKAAFSTSWWAFLGLTGISLGAAVSCKLVGILTIAVIGLSTIKQLVELPVSRTLWLQHFAARALCLIVVPAMIYLAAFAVHLQILNNPGEGDKYMSPAFQATLDGRRVPETFSDVAFGSEITLRHLETSNRYLQSHRYIYPTGGDQQQVFLANKTDHSVLWKIQHADATDHDYHHEDVMLITSGTQVRFRHLATDAYLASEDVRPPMSRLMTQNEVSGSNRETDENSNWIVEIKNGEDRLSKSRVRAIETTFRLKHARSGCYLFSHDVKLPQWAFFNQEVTCNKEGANLTGSMWYVETNGHPQCESHLLNEWPRLRALALADTEKVEKSAYSNPGFFWKVVELHEVMWDRNAEMTAPHKYASRPGAWPLLREGVRFWSRQRGDEIQQIFLIGNPLVWWASTAVIVASFIGLSALILLGKCRLLTKGRHGTCAFLIIAWAIHYFPFFTMSRQLFIHHYFPSLYFAILLSCVVFDTVTTRLSARFRMLITVLLALCVVRAWYSISPLTYAGIWSKSQCEHSKWWKEWNYICGNPYGSNGMGSRRRGRAGPRSA